MSAWVLILWINGVNGTSSIDHINFATEDSCMKARFAVLKLEQKTGPIESKDHPLFAVCVENK